MRIEILGDPVSVNEAYATVKGRRVKSRKAREYAEKRLHISGSKIDIRKDTRLSAYIEVHKKWFTSELNIRKNDLANYEKVLMDVVSERIGFDDSQIFKLELKKVDAKDPKVVVELDYVTHY